MTAAPQTKPIPLLKICWILLYVIWTTHRYKQKFYSLLFMSNYCWTLIRKLPTKYNNRISATEYKRRAKRLRHQWSSFKGGLQNKYVHSFLMLILKSFNNLKTIAKLALYPFRVQNTELFLSMLQKKSLISSVINL